MGARTTAACCVAIAAAFVAACLSRQPRPSPPAPPATQAPLSTAVVAAAPPAPGPAESWTPRPVADRRPIGFIGADGDRNDPVRRPTGLDGRIAAGGKTAYDYLMRMIVNRPYSRYLIHQPGGWLDQMTGAQYWGLDDSLRTIYETVIRDAMRQRPEITVGIYGSFQMGEGRSHSMRMGKYRGIDADDYHDRWTLWHQDIAPWVRAGAYEYWLDTGSHFSDAARQLCGWIRREQDFRVGLEAFPLVRSGDDLDLNTAVLQEVPCVAMLSFARQFDPKRRWTAPATCCEAVVIVAATQYPPVPGTEPTLEECVSLLRRGFVLGSIAPCDDLVVAAYAEVYGGIPREP